MAGGRASRSPRSPRPAVHADLSLRRSGTTATLVARGNVGADDPVASEQIDVDDGVWPIGRVLDGSRAAHPGASICRRRWRGRAAVGSAAAAGRGRADRAAGQSRPAGVFIAGLNPHRPVDAEFESSSRCSSASSRPASPTRGPTNERRRAEALAEIDRAKTAFFSNVSHEFRTPLTLMLGPLEDRVRDAAGDGSQEWLALGASQRAAAAEAREQRCSTSRASRRAACRRRSSRSIWRSSPPISPALFRASVERAGLRLLVDCRRSPEPVYVDRDMWEKIVLNLLSNAFKFTFEGEIAVALAGAGDQVRLTVRDTGTGIPDGSCRASSSASTASKARAAARTKAPASASRWSRSSSGCTAARVTVESVEGQGTTFTVIDSARHRAPAGGARSRRRRCARPHRRRPTPSSTKRRAGCHRGRRRDARARGLEDPADVAEGCRPPARDVLVADDNADMRDYLRRLLGARWQVTVCPTAGTRSRRSRADPPDLVITDVMMPELDGFGLLRRSAPTSGRATCR